MTDAATIDLPALHRSAVRSIARVETLESYAAESPDYRAWLAGEPRLERSVRTNDYLRRVAARTLDGVPWERLRVIDTPLTDYQRWELLAYVESQAAGEIVTLVERDDLPPELRDRHLDAWLVDDLVIRQEYDEAGAFLGRRYVDDAEAGEALHLAHAIRGAGVPLNVYLARAAVPAARRAS